MCLSPSSPAVGQQQRGIRAMQFAMTGFNAAKGSPDAIAQLGQLKQTFRDNHGGMNVKQVIQARRAGTVTGTAQPAITGGGI